MVSDKTPPMGSAKPSNIPEHDFHDKELGKEISLGSKERLSDPPPLEDSAS